ncbi:outer membrane protein insertion porin family [Lewinella marina]|uniref:Outer membrane protein assembly factor BamA n=1 Tax=Neolewinella marina TaxID=438751 RepID=A0A2G0CDG1_9BACT|nr:outer membrane protein assembly factor BamA [Neolewinella marina]NJB86032.1 outer membrane protein insertion porin family [Neolewinella marina]PHK98002.1 outer membrane protein assembly factor BamA [Neolewinella marina]
MRFSLFLLCLACFGCWSTLAAQADSLGQPVFNYSEPQEYEIGGIKIEGAFFAEENAIIGVTGLSVGQEIRIPGPDIPRAIRNLWRLRLFTNVSIEEEKTIGDVIFLTIRVEERPRFLRHSFTGAKQSSHEDLNEEVNKYIVRGGIVTEDAKVNAAEAIRGYYVEKGYLDAAVSVEEIPDTTRPNSVRLLFDINRNERVKIADINFIGNEAVKDKKLRKQMKETSEKSRLFKSSKFRPTEYETDKEAVITYYNNMGYRDARIVDDSLYRNEDGDLVIDINLNEGNQYYFRNITWKGNSIYDDATLDRVLGITRGDVYNEEELQTRLSFSQDNADVSSLYMDNGYLFFNVDPIEVAIEGDSIDLEMRIFEGPQATIDKVVINGNDRTHEHVIRRELFTRPGQKFSRSDIIRSQRQIIGLGYFNQETLGIETPVNPDRGTVDIIYTVEEKPSDQLELSAGWGGRRGVIGTLGVTFNNFSLRNVFNREAWHPLPQGDGQRLSLRAQTNGRFYQSYNASLTEPWLGGKRPTSLSVSAFYNKYDFGTSTVPRKLIIQQAAVSLGTRLRWPDDNFVFRTGLNLQTLTLDNWGELFTTDQNEQVTTGNYNNFSLQFSLSRNTATDPIYPKQGSNIELSVQATPPYRNLGIRDNPNLLEDVEERFRYVEYHKWRLNTEWYTPITQKLILKTQAKIGYLGSYDDAVGVSPFERFQLGGDGVNNQQFAFAGVDIISLRGYEIEDLPNNFITTETGGTRKIATPIFSKYTVELRYPLSLNPSSTIFVLAFAQGGNAWRTARDFNPFDLKRSVGLGARVFLPMFGTLGFDWGYGFDKNKDLTEKGNLSTFNIILGFEPE